VKLGQTGLPVDVIEIPAGEASKSVDTVVDVARQLLKLKASRQSLLVALGGGVVGDITGFVASIYMRSVPYVQIPTTLLAQVDSSVGGKTGVDLPEGKNLLGTFYQPRAVYIELSFLKSLSDKDFANGLAEIIKYGIIGDNGLFDTLEAEKDRIRDRDPELIQTMVARSCEIKAEIVEMDEKELGLRRILNFGHTLGHALEAASDYILFHGEAVAIGMVAASRISHKLNHLDGPSHDRICHVIEQYGLPTQIPVGMNTSDIMAHMGTDKKTIAGRLHLVLLKKIGVPFVTPDISLDEIQEAIEELKQ
jgi:3-dehydroquinate synthase